MPIYDEIMQDLNPRVIIEKTEIPHDNARASCTLQSSIVGSHREFEDLLIAYVAHHTEMIFGVACVFRRQWTPIPVFNGQ